MGLPPGLSPIIIEREADLPPGQPLVASGSSCSVRAMKAAAFFDLDRTLLRGASGPIVTAALKEAGVVSDRSVPGEGLFSRFYEVMGETLAGMALARRAARFASGWSSDAVVEAATQAAKVLTG